MEPASAPLVDTHCHLSFDSFDEDRRAVMDRAREAGLVSCVVVAVDAPSACQARDLARAEPGWLHATAGIHPNEESAAEPAAFDEIRDLVGAGDFVAVGETGLDLYRDNVDPAQQRASLRRHLELALDHDLPVVLHCRDAFDEMVEALAEFRGAPLRGVLHCFTGTEADVDPLLEAGLHIGVGGIATFKPRADLRAAVRRVPLERLLLETDAPFLAPVPMRGRRNEPSYVAHVADVVSADRGVDRADLSRRTTRNADRLFGLGLDED